MMFVLNTIFYVLNKKFIQTNVILIQIRNLLIFIKGVLVFLYEFFQNQMILRTNDKLAKFKVTITKDVILRIFLIFLGIQTGSILMYDFV